MTMSKITAEEPQSKSRDVQAENLATLSAMFPELLTEGPDGVAVNLDVLKSLLGDRTVTDAEERYGLNWHGKRKARQLALTPSTGTLRPCPEDSVNWDTTQNLMIEGDNLEVLKLLQKSYAGKVKLIYIDPPYNTGKDFVYPDNFQDNIKNYLELTGQTGEGGKKLSSNTEASGRFHTDWLNMMYPRLKLARDLLREDGVIFISIDDHEEKNLLRLCDEVMGEENFVGVVVWQTSTDNNPRQIATDHEYVVCYAKDIGVQPEWVMESEKAKIIQVKYQELRAKLGNDPAIIEIALKSWIKACVQGGDNDLDGVAHYSYVDEKGVFYPGNSANTRAGGYSFDIYHPMTGAICAKPENGYRWPQATFDSAAKNGDVLWGDDDTSVPKIKKRIETATQLLKSSYYEDNRASTKALTSLMGEKVFDNPKSPRLLSHLFGFTVEKCDIVVDFFAGSGTTAESVIAQNAADQGERRFVLVQLPELLDSSKKEQKTAADYCTKLKKPRNIAELTKERLRRAGKKIKEENPLFTGDLGFRVFKLASSNIQAWEPDRDKLAETLEASIEHLKTDRTEQDILFELLLKLGLDLCVPIEKRKFAGKEVHAIGGGVLFACLTEKISRTDVEALAQGIVAWNKEFLSAVGYTTEASKSTDAKKNIKDDKPEATCVFRDSGFVDDVAKTNLAAILQQHGLLNVRSL